MPLVHFKVRYIFTFYIKYTLTSLYISFIMTCVKEGIYIETYLKGLYILIATNQM